MQIEVERLAGRAGEGDGPPVERIVAAVREGVHSGGFSVGHRLPTVRALAAEMGVAVNTVAKAYRRLEAEGTVEGRGRAGTFIARSGVESDARVDGAVQRLIEEALRAGMPVETVLARVEAAFPG